MDLKRSSTKCGKYPPKKVGFCTYRKGLRPLQTKKYIFPSLTVRKRKNRCIPHVYWGIAIFAVVADYSILFFPFTFFLNISHFTFCYELIICSETTDIMKIVRNSFSFV